MKKFIILLFLSVNIFAHGIGSWAVYQNKLFLTNFRTKEACESYLLLFYKDQKNVECKRFR